MANPIVEQKRCGRCGKAKRPADFHRSKGKPDGLQGTCKECRQQISKENVASGVKRQEGRRCYAKKKQNPALWAAELERRRRWWKCHPEKQRAKYRRRYALRKDKYIAKSHRRRAMLAGGGGSHTASEWRRLKLLYGGVCLACGCRGKLTRDHVIPVSKGGTDDIENLQPLCLLCNLKKQTKVVDYRLRHRVALSELNKVGRRIYSDTEKGRETGG